MDAIRVKAFGGPEVLELVKDVPRPSPGADEVLIRVRAVGVNPVETYLRSGKFPVLPDLPYTPGNDAAGEIAEVGSDVKNFKVGDRVLTGAASGAYAQYTLSKAAVTQPLPATLSFEEGACIPLPYLTACRALRVHSSTGAKEGQSLLIHGGTGGVGLASIQLGRTLGLRVLATGGTDKGLELMKEQGAHAVFNHRKEGYQDEIMAETGGEGVDIIVENVASANLDADTKMLKLGGRVMMIGSKGTTIIDPMMAIAKELQICGVLVYRNTQEELEKQYAVIQAGAESGQVKPVIARRYTLGEACTAQGDIITNTGTLGKLVLVVD